MKRIAKLIIIKSSLVLFTILLLSVNANPLIQKPVIVDTTNLRLVRCYNEETLKQIDYEFQRAAQFKQH